MCNKLPNISFNNKKSFLLLNLLVTDKDCKFTSGEHR
jgi:hypothetical protein